MTVLLLFEMYIVLHLPDSAASFLTNVHAVLRSYEQVFPKAA